MGTPVLPDSGAGATAKRDFKPVYPAGGSEIALSGSLRWADSDVAPFARGSYLG